MCDSSDQAAHYHIPHLQFEGFISDPALGCLQRGLLKKKMERVTPWPWCDIYTLIVVVLLAVLVRQLFYNRQARSLEH
jgi:hypothetical protein